MVAVFYTGCRFLRLHFSPFLPFGSIKESRDSLCPREKRSFIGNSVSFRSIYPVAVSQRTFSSSLCACQLAFENAIDHESFRSFATPRPYRQPVSIQSISALLAHVHFSLLSPAVGARSPRFLRHFLILSLFIDSSSSSSDDRASSLDI